MKTIPISAAPRLPFWRRPIFMLFVMTAAMPISLDVWMALLNNFVVDVADFDGADIGLLHSVREIPGFLAIAVIIFLMFMREQVLATVSLLMLGAATAVTAWFPSMAGILTITMLSSIGFHYYETVKQSLQLQWINKKDAPMVLGWMVTVGSAASLIAYATIIATWKSLGLGYNTVYLVSGGITVALALFCFYAYPQFQAPIPQRNTIVLRKRYWLYYLLQFMAGARRQIFVVFAAFMMVERFGMDVHELTSLLMVTFVLNMVLGPIFGKFVEIFGERKTLALEYIGLTGVFLAYGGIYAFGWGIAVAMALYVIDNIFFAMALALKTYFQKIADPADIAPTAAVAFTINHIAAVFLPVLLGLLWIASPFSVFVLAAAMAMGSFCLALMIPRHPAPEHETVFSS